MKNPIFIPKKKEEEKKEVKKVPTRKSNQRSNSLIPRETRRFNPNMKLIEQDKDGTSLKQPELKRNISTGPRLIADSHQVLD